MRPAIGILACAVGLVAEPLWGQTVPATPEGENLARGASYALAPAPNYSHCTDPGDREQLTDGKLTEGYFWTQTGTVGWSGSAYATITVDLGIVRPIGGASLRTAAGVAGVTWPASIRILTSDDGQTWHEAGDLVAQDRVAQGPWPEGYAVRRLVAHSLASRGRYVRFVIIPPGGGPFLFADEVEVFRGDEALLARAPSGPVVNDVEELFRAWRNTAGIARRFEQDVALVRKEIDQAPLGDDARQALRVRADQAAAALTAQPAPPAPDFRAVIPYGPEHAALFALRAEVWKARGGAPWVAWVPNTWDPAELEASPPAESAGTIAVDAMQGEYRASAVNLAARIAQPRTVRVRFEGIPGSPAPPYLSVADVPWTDTGSGVPVLAALPEARREGDAWLCDLDAGLTGQLWLTFHPTDLAPGVYTGSLLAESDGLPALRVPVRFRVWPFDFPKQTTLWLGGWSYVNAGAYGMTPENADAFVAHLRSHFVNAPWATSQVLMTCRFDPADASKVELDPAAFDAWIDRFPDARAYLVFLSAGDSLDGSAVGTPEFRRKVAAWISAWVGHLGKRGIAPNRLGLLIADEPHEGSNQEATIVGWAKAIHAAEPQVLVWEDPTYSDPAAAPAELFEACSVLCPNRPMWLEGGAKFAEFYLSQQDRGRTLQLYSCSGPARLLDPYGYYRLQAWHCWQIGATGSFFWAFGDNSGASSWNEYLANQGPYTPLYLDSAGVTPGKQMEAIRESVEDYEYLVLLRDAIQRARAAGGREEAVRQAQSVLDLAAGDVLSGPGATSLRWHEPQDRTLADRMRIRVLEALKAVW